MNSRFVVGIGVQKAATTSIANFLQQNGVAIHPKKELAAIGYPEHRLTRDEYLSLFPQPIPDGWFGEFSPNYCIEPHSMLQLHQLFPEARVVFSYRNPIARLRSAYIHGSTESPELARLSLNEWIDLAFRGHANHWISNLLQYGQYDVILRSVERIFEPSNLHILRFEDLGTEREAAALTALLNWLELAPQTDLIAPKLNTAASKSTRGVESVNEKNEIGESNLARLIDFYTPTERFMRERGHRTEWF